MKRNNILFLLLGLVLGFVLAFALLYVPDQAVQPEPGPTMSPAVSTSTLPAWDARTVYNGGDTVLYEGRIYRAKWWTQGEAPGGADVWEDTLEAPLPTPTAMPAATPAPSRIPAEKSAAAAGFKVVGYYPSWEPDRLDAPRWDVLTHVNYAFAIPTPEGGLRPLEHPETAQALIVTAHANGVKVLLAVGGWSYNDVPLEATFVSATETEDKRNAFADAILTMCDAYGFDGVDMDWEHPRVDGSSGAQYEALMLTLARRLHEAGKLLTCAVLSGATADGNVYYDAAAHSDQVLAAVDWLNVMAYDGGDGERHSPYSFAVDCGAYWRDTRGVPADKVVLGLPFYARPSWAAYGDILAAVPEARNGDHCSYNGMEVWYNGPDTIGAKTHYALEALGGVMIWELTQDSENQAHSLQEAILNALQGAA